MQMTRASRMVMIQMMGRVANQNRATHPPPSQLPEDSWPRLPRAWVQAAVVQTWPHDQRQGVWPYPPLIHVVRKTKTWDKKGGVWLHPLIYAVSV